ncbi:MAG: DUF1190 domain-containing protein [Pseudomonadota bacterium]
MTGRDKGGAGTARPVTRKSSTGRKTLALGTIAATTAAVAGCDDGSSKLREFKTVGDCQAAGFSSFICERQYGEALARHVRQAPRYETKAACETVFGKDGCSEMSGVTGQRWRRTPNTSGGVSAGGNATTEQQPQTTFFAPLLTGFMMAQALRSVSSPHAYYSWRRDYPTYSSTPIYTNRSGKSVTARQGRGTRPPVVRPANVNTRTVSRRGFGGRSSSRGFRRSWGG